ncbi:PEP-CTERM sorting domain-containing protein [Arsukibacterium sp.]|uniref:PEP-CTERM sorting domain-containing protein n=1 Tax=Arsukibacterium sp. TaxID=1977258 RepID=UPI001BD50468|nr:PEP-CTERM sorting domain-containing protein [Arsukibacterium sp.]
MSRTLKLLTLPFLALFFFAQFAEATLVRSSGRGTLSGNYSQAFYFVDNQYLNEVGIIESAFEFDSPFAANSIVRAIGGGGPGVSSVPNDCTFGYTQDDLDNLELDIDYWRTELSYGRITDAQFDAEVAALEFAIYGEPCVWEFNQGDALDMFGFFSLYFDTPDVSYNVNWLIDGVSLPGDINTAGDLVTPDGTINNGWVTLNTPPTMDFAPGDYMAYVSVGLSSSQGRFFWTSSEPGNEIVFEEKCIEKPNPDFDPDNPDLGIDPFIDVCGYTNVYRDSLEVSDPPLSFFSDGEMLRILPASNGPVTQVNAPASIALLLLGLVALIVRRRQPAAQ